MPMWRLPHTIRSPGAGFEPAGIALPELCAQDQTDATEPKPWPWSPSGTPAWRAAQEAKYAHQGPTPEPAVAWRYMAMRGESLEPGGDSAWPTSPRAMLTIAWPAFVPGAAAGAAPVAPNVTPVPIAPCSALSNDVVVAGDGCAAGAACGGAKADSIAWMRAMTSVMLMVRRPPPGR